MESSPSNSNTNNNLNNTVNNTENILFPIDLSIFKEHVKISFQNILDSLPKSQKTLVIEQSCIKRLDFFLDFQVLKERNVKKGIVVLSKTTLNTDSPNIIYVISANKSSLEDILFQIQNHRRDGIDRKYTVIFIPKINYDCQVFIEKNYLKAELNIQNLPIDMIPLDNDILSLEAPETISELFIKNNTNILSVISRAIVKFETVFGKIKYKYAKGDYSKVLKKIIENEEEISPFESDTEILAAVLLDRSVDFITPLCSQYTYEGMIDEFIGINYNIIKVKPEILEKNEKNDIKVELSSKDIFYNKIRDFNFNHLRCYLPSKLDEHKKILAEGNKQTNDLNEISSILEKIKQVKEESPSLATHINIADYISNIIKHPFYTEFLRYEQNLLVGGDSPNYIYDFYENEIGKQSEISKVLRLMCLESIIQNGLKSKLYDGIKRDFLNVYGYQEIFLLKNLEKLRILKKQDQKSNYEFINENLGLIKDDVNIMDPDDSAYVFGGFCPITIRLIEALVKRGWNSIKEVIKKLPGDYDYPAHEKEIVNVKNRTNFILVVFLGGVTYAEIAAIRFLNKKLRDHKFIILTTHIINGKKFIEGLRETFETSLTLKEYYTQLRQLGYESNK